MATSGANGLLIIGGALILFGAFAYWRESRRGRRMETVIFLLGFPGMYLYIAGLIQRIGWLEVLGVVLLCSSQIGGLLYRRQVYRRQLANRSRNADRSDGGGE